MMENCGTVHHKSLKWHNAGFVRVGGLHRNKILDPIQNRPLGHLPKCNFQKVDPIIKDSQTLSKREFKIIRPQKTTTETTKTHFSPVIIMTRHMIRVDRVSTWIPLGINTDQRPVADTSRTRIRSYNLDPAKLRSQITARLLGTDRTVKCD